MEDKQAIPKLRLRLPPRLDSRFRGNDKLRNQSLQNNDKVKEKKWIDVI
jgi:hypothetical protein